MRGGVDSKYRHIARIAVPVGLEAIFQMAFTFVDQVIVGVLGATSVAAVGLSTSVAFVLICMFSSTGAGCGILIAQARGLRDMRGVLLTLNIGQVLVGCAGILVCSAFLLPFFYRNVGGSVLRLAFAGILVVAFFLPVKVSNNVMGNGVLPSGKDTKFVLFSTLAGQYLVGIPGGQILGLILHFGFWGVFAARRAEELVKLILFIIRFRGRAWCRYSIREPSAEMASS
jgi:Na+-driven multidrug efflux pump